MINIRYYVFTKIQQHRLKYLFQISIAFFLFPGCQYRPSQSELSYIRIVTSGPADSFTTYNKGAGLNHYAYYDFKKDSLIYRELMAYDHDREKSEYRTFVARLKGSEFINTIRELTRVLKTYEKGIIPLDTGTDIYDGPGFYVEFADKDGLHHYVFFLDGTDVFNQFSDYFYALPASLPQKYAVDNSMVKADSEVVNSMIRLGLYENRGVPGILPPCEDSVDFSKIYGSWRIIRRRYEERSAYYYQLSFGKDGLYTNEKMEENKIASRLTGRYLFNSKDSTLTIIVNEKKDKYKVEKLTGHCLNAVNMENDRFLKLEKLP